MKNHRLIVRIVTLTAAILIHFGFIFAAMAQPTISITATDAASAETWPGQTPDLGAVRLTRSGSAAGSLTINARLRGDALPDADYTITSSSGPVLTFSSSFNTTLTFPAGQSNIFLTITPVDDLIPELPKFVRVEIQSPNVVGQYLIAGNGRAEVTLADNDDPNTPPRARVSVVALDETASEGTGGVPVPGTFRFSRDVNTNVALTVAYELGGSATPGDDYAALSGSVLIPSGVAFADVVIAPVDDADLEGDETVTLAIVPSSCPGIFPPPAICYTLGASTNAELTLLDNEIPPVRAVVSVAALNNAAENVSGAPVSGAFRITRSANLDVELTVAYTVGGTATPTDDFAALSGSVVIPAGVASANVVVAPVDDALLEGAESVTLTITPTACPELYPPAECYLVATSSALLTILDNEIAPTITLNTFQNPNVTGSPAAGLGTFTGAATNGHIVSYQVRVDGVLKISGVTGYTNPPAPGTPFQHNFAITNLTAGNHTVQATVTDNQGFSATATASLFISILVPPFTIEIIALDNDAAETLPGEPPNTAKFLYRQSGTSTEELFFFLSFAGSARQGIDYTVNTGPWVNTTNGVTNIWSQEFTIIPIDDYLIEGTETVTLQTCFINLICIYGVCAPGGTSCGGGTTINLYDNDTNPPPYAVVSVTASDADAQEVSTLSGNPQNPGAFTITRTAPLTNDLTVNYLLGGVAKNGVDYETISNSVVIPIGAASATIAVNPIFDTFVEGNEAVTLTLRPVTNAPLYLLDPGAINSATVTIRDYAPANIPVVSVYASDVQAIEENVYSRTAAFTVSRVGGLATNLTIPYTLDGTASNGVDYVTLPGVVTITSITPNTTIIVNPIADGIVEPVETVGLTLQPPSPDVFPPPYLFSAAANRQTMAGVTIRDTALYPAHPYLTRAQRVFLRRHPNRHVVVPLPPTVFNNPLVAPPTNTPTITWAVEASADMVSWAEIGTTSDPEEFVDVTAGDAPQRFYRFRQTTPAAQ